MFFAHRTAQQTTSGRNRMMRNAFGNHRSAGPNFRVSDRLHEERSVTVTAHEIATTVAGWLADLGVHSPLTQQLADAVGKGDWSTARAIADNLAVTVTYSY